MSTEWITCTLTVPNGADIHMRPAIQFANLANKFEADVLVEYRGCMADGKSINQVAMLVVAGGDKIILKAKGVDATKVIQALSALVQDGFRSDYDDPPSLFDAEVW